MDPREGRTASSGEDHESLAAYSVVAWDSVARIHVPD